MKTPEELAEEFADSGLYRLKRYVDGRVKPSQGAHGLQNRACAYGFRAGYEAAKEHAHAALEEAEVEIDRLQTKLSDAGILTTEHLLGTDNSSNNSNGWISVKDRLPEDHKHYLVISNVGIVQAPVWYNGCPYWDVELAYYSRCYERWMTGDPTLKDVPENKVKFEVTHWMPLPKPPEE